MASRFFESGFLSVENDGQFEYILKSKYDTKTCARKVKGYLLHYLNFKSDATKTWKMKQACLKSQKKSIMVPKSNEED